MSMCTVSDALVVNTPLCQTPVILKHIEKVDGITFAKLCKGDSYVRRLVLAKCVEKPSNMSLGKAVVFDELIALRDEVIKQATQDAVKAFEDDEFQSLCLDAPSKKRKAPDVDIPEIATVRAPSHGDVEGIDIRLRLKKEKALWAEVTPSVVEYLMDIVKSQVEYGTRSVTCIRHGSPEGTTFMKGKQLLRISRIDENTNKKTYKHIKVTSDEPSVMRSLAIELRNSSPPSSSESF